MRSRDLLIGGSITALIVLLAIGRSGDGIEGGTVFMLLLFGLLLVGLIVLKTNRKQESQSSTTGVLKHNQATLETNLTETKENLKDPLDEGFDIPL
jgi:Zn-dependent protease with chaperone function